MAVVREKRERDAVTFLELQQRLSGQVRQTSQVELAPQLSEFLLVSQSMLKRCGHILLFLLTVSEDYAVFSGSLMVSFTLAHIHTVEPLNEGHTMTMKINRCSLLVLFGSVLAPFVFYIMEVSITNSVSFRARFCCRGWKHEATPTWVSSPIPPLTLPPPPPPPIPPGHSEETSLPQTPTLWWAPVALAHWGPVT